MKSCCFYGIEKISLYQFHMFLEKMVRGTVALTTLFFCLQYKKTVSFVDGCFKIWYINCPDLCEKSYITDFSKVLA